MAFVYFLVDAYKKWDGEPFIFAGMSKKQGYALKNSVEGFFDAAHYPWESPKKKLTKMGKPYNCP